MVLPAPASDDASAAVERKLIERLKLILRLGASGVLVLVDRARPERLGWLVRTVAAMDPDVEVHVDAGHLWDARKGAAVVLVAEAAQAQLLNIERPVLAERALRVVLFSDAATSAVLAMEAPDFFDWISHRFECPPGGFRPAVLGIRAASTAGAAGFAWSGGDLDAAFAEALPACRRERVSARTRYRDLVESVRAAADWIQIDGMDGEPRLRRVRWALAEAKRTGRVVLWEAASFPPGFVSLHGLVMPLREAFRALEAAGASNAGRLAALLDLEPEAVQAAAALLGQGMAQAEIEGALAGAIDPGAVVGRLSLQRGVVLPSGSSLRFRAVGPEPVIAAGDAAEAAVRAGHWVEAASQATALGDTEVADAWMLRAPPAPQPIPATRDTLAKVLECKPVLWVGAGLSIGAGYPSTGKLVEEMARAAHDPIDTSLPFFAVADAFVASVGKAQLAELMQKLFAKPRKSTAVHQAIARLAGAGRLHAIVTTNFDTLLEHALYEAGVPYLLQPLDDNASITGEGESRIFKIHGSQDDWMKIILSGRAYADFGRRYPFLMSQLDVLLKQRPVLFAGCSLQDPRILGWLAALSDEAADALKPWRALVTDKEWQSALAYRWQDDGVQRDARTVLARSRVRPLILETHAQLGTLLNDVAGETVVSAERLELNVHAGDTLRASLAGCPDWTPRDPRADPNLGSVLHDLRTLADTPLPTDEHGAVAAAVAMDAARLRSLAERVAGALTEALLSDEAGARIAAAIRVSTGSAPPLLLLRVHAGGDSDEARRRADRLLALPWELLRIDGEFPVESGKLDMAREAVVPDAPGLEPPARELTVVATVAAPVDAVRLDYEGECYRLWRAMGAEERRLLITDLGTQDAFVDAVCAHAPAAIHFTGHGTPGVLLFEDDTARSAKVAVRDLIARLCAGALERLPRLAFLASCYGAAIERAEIDPKSRRMVDPAAFADDPAWSSAAELHRAGIHQVIAWLGPVGDAQCTRAEATVYAELVRGHTARQAIRKARQVCREPHREGARATHVYPLGWAQLALYHRGADVPVALPATDAGADLGRDERKRRIERLDKSRGPVGVERLQFGFIGRRTARAEVIGRFREGCRTLVIQGLGGLGKTALCAELAPILAREVERAAPGDKPGPVRVVALDGRFAGQQADPVAALWEQVQAFGEGDGWNQALAALQRDGITGEALAGALVWLAKHEGGLLVYLDDAESLQQPLGQGDVGAWKHPSIGAFWQALLAATQHLPRFALLASARYVPQGLAEAAWYPLGVMREIDLVRLVRWWPVLGRLGAEDVAWLAERIDGHPRSLQWLDGFARDRAEKLAAPGRPFIGDLRREVIEPVLPRRDAKLSEDLLLPRLIDAVGAEPREHLRRCTILGEPSPWGAILALQDDEGTGKRLAQVGLLSAFEPPHGGEPLWAPHRMVAEAAGRLAEKDAIEAHRRVGAWFRAQWEQDEWALDLATEAARHLCAAGDGNGAWEPAQRVVLVRRHLGRYREALAWVERVLAAGASGPERGNALAFEVQLGCFAGAPPQQAEARLKEALGLVGEQDQAFVLSELGNLYRHGGRLREAAQALEQSVAIEIKVKGAEHANVAASLHALAVVLQAQGDLSGARERLERSLRIKAKVFGTEEHPEVAASLQALAVVLQAQGDLSGARERLERSLRVQAKVYGTEEHPSVAASLHALARVLQAQGDLTAARERLERSLRIQAKVYGTEEHPHVAASLHELARVLQAQGDLSGARERLERSLRIQAKVYGTEEHPEVAASLHELAGVLQAQGDLSGARERLERSLAIQERVYGTRDHYLTAITEMNLGGLLLELGEPQRGVELLLHAYQTFLAQLGPSHPYTQQLEAFFRRQNNPLP